MARRSPPWSRRLLALLERGLPRALLADNALRRRALLIAGTVWTIVVACLASVPVIIATTAGTGRILSLIADILAMVLALVALRQLRDGAQLGASGHLVTGIVFTSSAFAISTTGGFTSQYWILLAAIPFLAAQTAGHAATRTWGLACVAFIVLLCAVMGAGVELPQFTTGLSIYGAAFYGVMCVLVVQFLSHLADLAKDEAVARAEQFADQLLRADQEVGDARILAEQAVAANSAKSAFMATMSHELRTPLNAVIGYAELLAEDAESQGLHSMRTDLVKIVGASQHLLTLIEDILDLSAVEAERLDLRRDRFAVEELVGELADTLEPLARKRRNTLEVVHTGPTVAADLDRARVRQVLINLIGNAIKFTSHGRITVQVRSELEGSRRWVILVVEDTGIGISEADLRRIFEPFTQVDSSPRRRYEGSGLGLSLCKRLVEMMDGTLTVRSHPGEGSAFTVRLPAALAARPERAALDVAC